MRVFLNYRRSDTAIHATAMKYVLEEHLPGIVIFVDTDSMEIGDQWPSRLRTELEDASAVLVLIGDDWRFSSAGVDRFEDERDWVGNEITIALDRHPGRVIPIRIADDFNTAKFVTNFEALPKRIAEIGNIQAVDIRPESYLADLKKVVGTLSKLLEVGVTTREVSYPKPNTLKSRAPKIGRSEFENLLTDLRDVEGWRYAEFTEKGKVGTELRKLFEFKNFRQALGFMYEAGLVCETKQHHPIWTNRWNIVNVELRTFDAGQMVTWYDVELAERMNRIADGIVKREKAIWPPR